MLPDGVPAAFPARRGSRPLRSGERPFVPSVKLAAARWAKVVVKPERIGLLELAAARKLPAYPAALEAAAARCAVTAKRLVDAVRDMAAGAVGAGERASGTHDGPPGRVRWGARLKRSAHAQRTFVPHSLD